MEAAKLCQAASRRLGFHLRRSSVAHCRRELRAAQRVVDNSRQVILATAQLTAAARAEGQLDDLLNSLIPDVPVLPLSATGAQLTFPSWDAGFAASDTGSLDMDASQEYQQSRPTEFFQLDDEERYDTSTQTDHLLRCRLHALAFSKGTENPEHELAGTFKLNLSVVGPELDNSVGKVSCSDPVLRAKIIVEGAHLCSGTLRWTTKELLTGPSVECKLSTNEVLTMAKRISDARSTRGYFGRDCDDACSEASTGDASSLGYTSSAELSGFDSDFPPSDRAAQETFPRRRFARARRSAGSAAPRKNDAATNAGTDTNTCDTLPTLVEEDSDPLLCTPLKT
eukprot:TRINITY_DN28062_c1_g1_i1.p1 TRINITY_DN28062_c1_g1~~TRINITY_DN28062_c1_g1_i1.p1  ORF type:complete len:339 (+),score=27.96 TRINITY_DN28062_c1_g1_i1:33-1049(+)